MFEIDDNKFSFASFLLLLFLKGINLLIRVNNTIDRSTESKVLKILKDDVAYRFKKPV